jgi:hypothetical protein
MPFAVPQWPSAECTATYGIWSSTFPFIVQNCTVTTTATTTGFAMWGSGTNVTAYSAWNQTFPAIIQGEGTPLSVQTFFTLYTTTEAAGLSPEDRILAEARAYERSRALRDPERAAQRAREREQARAQMAVLEREHAAANSLAEDLLMACLSPQQAGDHVRLGWFDVVSSRGRRFRIYTRTPADPRYYPGQAGNVVLLAASGSNHEARYCVHPPGSLPDADAWLAQKLALEADEDSVMRVANMPWSRTGHLDIRPAARSRHAHRPLARRLAAVA